jgi:hypothetical protein
VQNNKNYCLIDLEKEHLISAMIQSSNFPLLIVNVAYLRNLNDEKTNDDDDGAIIIITIAKMALTFDHNNGQQHLVIVLRKFLQ